MHSKVSFRIPSQSSPISSSPQQQPNSDFPSNPEVDQTLSFVPEKLNDFLKLATPNQIKLIPYVTAPSPPSSVSSALFLPLLTNPLHLHLSSFVILLLSFPVPISLSPCPPHSIVLNLNREEMRVRNHCSPTPLSVPSLSPSPSLSHPSGPTKLTSPIPNRSPHRAHPPCRLSRHPTMGQHRWQCEPAHEQRSG